MGRYFYHENIQNFLKDSNDSILGIMAHNNSFELGLEQRDSWIEEIKILKGILEHLDKKGDIIFEYTIPRLGKRVDVVLLINGVIFAIEFKVKTGEDSDFEIKLRNNLTQRAIAKECADWIRQKVRFKTNVSNMLMPGFLNVQN